MLLVELSAGAATFANQCGGFSKRKTTKPDTEPPADPAIPEGHSYISEGICAQGGRPLMIAGALDCSEESGHAVRSGSAVMGLLLNPPPEHISYTCSHKQCSKKKKKKNVH